MNIVENKMPHSLNLITEGPEREYIESSCLWHMMTRLLNQFVYIIIFNILSLIYTFAIKIKNNKLCLAGKTNAAEIIQVSLQICRKSWTAISMV